MKPNEFIIAPENAGKSIVEIMQLYSDQQNKELREENQKQKEVIAWADEELSRLKSGKESQLVEELTRLRELLAEAREWIYDHDMILKIDNALNHKP